MTEHIDPGDGENLEQIYEALRWPGVELAAGRIAATAIRAVNTEIAHQQRLLKFEITVPNETERAAYLAAAGDDLERAISLAQWGIPPELAAANPDAEILDLARRAHRSTT